MKTELKMYTIEEITKDFTYNELEGKGLYGLSGELVIQPEFQRNYIYNEDKKDQKVIESILNGYPIGLIYFSVGLDEDGNKRLEVLDGQQRITSIGRYVEGRFSVETDMGEQSFTSLPGDKQELIKNTELLVYVCDGTESEIKQWFKTINIAGVPLNDQELRNAVYSGSFVTLAKREYSNSKASKRDMWTSYISGNIARQEILETALQWVADSQGKTIDGYMSEHRKDDDIDELKTYFETVINWVGSRFPGMPHKTMKGLPWGKYYERWGQDSYDGEATRKRVEELLDDPAVKNKKGIYPFILGGEKETNLLKVRLFNKPMKQAQYNKQTKEAKQKGISNCPYCAVSSHENQRTKIYTMGQMEADHVTAWSKGGETTPDNCLMLCSTHNKAKGNS